MKKRPTWGAALMLMLLAAVAAVNVTFLVMTARFNSQFEDLSRQKAVYTKFDTVKSYVEKFFVGEYDADLAMEGALKGYVSSLGDTWSHYLTKEEYQVLQQSYVTEYAGIGISVLPDPDDDNVVLVMEVYAGSPAEEAGIHPRDRILAVDGADVRDLGYAAALEKLRGTEGTRVSLKLLNADAGTIYEAELTRRSVHTEAVESRMLEGNVGYLRIKTFESGTETEFAAKLQALTDAGATALIFDVRYNGGGALDTMVAMLDPLLPEGTVIETKNKAGEAKTYTSDAAALDLPMAVITNRYSFSAAEFFAAALKDYGKAVLVGEATTGKGFAQSVIPLDDGSCLYLSTEQYYTPKGESLAGVGTTPDIEAALSDEAAARFPAVTAEEDTQLAAALAALAE